MENIQNTVEGMWGRRRKRGDEEGEGEHFYPLQHPKDRSILMQMAQMIFVNFAPKTKFWLKFCSTEKCEKATKWILHQNSIKQDSIL